MKTQLAKMHKEFGKEHVHTCGECRNLVRMEYNRVLFKCRRYGISSCAASDWALSWKACRMFGKPLLPGERPLKDYADRRREPAGEIPGQVGLFETN